MVLSFILEVGIGRYYTDLHLFQCACKNNDYVISNWVYTLFYFSFRIMKCGKGVTNGVSSRHFK